LESASQEAALAGRDPADLTEKEQLVTDTTTSERAVASSFGELGVSDDILGALDRLGFTEPFPVQTMCIPDLLAGKDVCGRAQTGSGKTLAFGIPLVERTEKAQPNRPRALILTPTRELCRQVASDLEPLAEARGLTVTTVYGGADMDRQINALKRGTEIVVATPGRLIDLMERKVAIVSDVETVVLDEADQMADMGFLPQVRVILDGVGGGHQTMLFSATLDGQVGVLVRRYMHDPVTHEVEKRGDDISDEQEHRFLLVHHMDKVKVAAAIAESAERTLIFVRTKRGCDRLGKSLESEGVKCRVIHGDRRQSERQSALAELESGKTPVLVATNVAARGLHIEDIDVVMHYDPPDDYKSFVHRSGRTARAGETGLVVTLVEWDQVKEVERLQRASGLHTEIVKMFSNDPRLEDLEAWEPDEKKFKKLSDADLSRRVGRRRRRR
jgi:superfamily II DNA/RNA helicase